MDTESFEEVAVPFKLIEDKADLLAEGMEVILVNFKGKAIEVQLPSPATYVIAETEPNIKGNTAQGYTKPAVLSSGATISVPGYLEAGETIRVDTEKRVFLERVTK